MDLAGALLAGAQTRAKYESSAAQRAALAVIPQEIAALPVGNDKAVQLLHWFKTRFFTWTNAPKCASCGAETQMESMSGPTAPIEVEGEASRVEVYQCISGCPTRTRFPRFNNPVTLLSSRTGRCGEWANCFTLCAVACGFKARYVLDLTDHVWTEIFSPEWNRWVHCDSCEDAFDTPMVYEAGWGKKLSFVLAFGPERGVVTDVTRRYSRRFDAEMIIVRYGLLNACPNFVPYVQSHKDPETWEAEEAEFLESMRSQVPLKPEELQGRLSGSVEWRAQRGETSVGVASLVLDASVGSIQVNGAERSPMRRGINCVAISSSGQFSVFAYDTMHDPAASAALQALLLSDQYSCVVVAAKGSFKWPSELAMPALIEGTQFVGIFEHAKPVLLSRGQLRVPLENLQTQFLARFEALLATGVQRNRAVSILAQEIDFRV